MTEFDLEPVKQQSDNLWRAGYSQTARILDDVIAEVTRLQAENARLYKKAYFTIKIPSFLRRKT